MRWGSNSSQFYRLTAGVRQGGALSPCVRWNSNSSEFYRLTAGVRQGGALSPCVRWDSNSSEFYRLTSGVRQGGALSPCVRWDSNSSCLFALYVHDVIIKVASCGIDCHLGFACVSIIVYADDILLLDHFISSLQCIYAKVS